MGYRARYSEGQEEGWGTGRETLKTYVSGRARVRKSKRVRAMVRER